MNHPDDAKFAPSGDRAEVGRFEVDESTTTAHYANYCRMSGTAEELLMDFGLDPLQSTRSVVVTQRIVTGWHTAKRLQQVLQLTIEQHETAFGVLETDVQKRNRRAQRLR